MKKIAYIFIVFAPLLYISLLFQKFPLLLRGYLPAVGIFVLHYKRPKWAVLYAILTALIIDSYISAAIGAALFLHVMFLFATQIWERYIPHPSPVAAGVICAVSMVLCEPVLFILLVTFGWHVSMMDFQSFFLVPLATGIYGAILDAIVFDEKDDYQMIRKDSDA